MPKKRSREKKKKVYRNFRKICRRLGQKLKKGEDRRSNRTRQNNKRADRKMESNDNPEIPERGKTSEESGLPWGPNNTGV